MSGKDLLAVLAMIVPSLTLIAAIAFALGLSARENVHDGRDAPMLAKPHIATQKRMRDPWGKAVYAKTSSAPRVAQCDPSMSNQETPCFYW